MKILVHKNISDGFFIYLANVAFPCCRWSGFDVAVKVRASHIDALLSKVALMPKCLVDYTCILSKESYGRTGSSMVPSLAEHHTNSGAVYLG